MSTRRKQRIKHLLATAPEDISFQGYGGMSLSCETMVFYDQRTGYEIRFPLDLRGWQPTKQEREWGYDSFAIIEKEYGCWSFWDWPDYESE